MWVSPARQLLRHFCDQISLAAPSWRTPVVLFLNFPQFGGVFPTPPDCWMEARGWCPSEVPPYFVFFGSGLGRRVVPNIFQLPAVTGCDYGGVFSFLPTEIRGHRSFSQSCLMHLTVHFSDEHTLSLESTPCRGAIGPSRKRSHHFYRRTSE